MKKHAVQQSIIYCCLLMAIGQNSQQECIASIADESAVRYSVFRKNALILACKNAATIINVHKKAPDKSDAFSKNDQLFFVVFYFGKLCIYNAIVRFLLLTRITTLECIWIKSLCTASTLCLFISTLRDWHQDVL
ncbi:hypothetical protein F952_02759 [Acinetobacter baylyi DSM 14961 = CIP 107474]|nr:hypothetical protein F952_02759 [Acinetobacter baylyi DSM 14961 = CIP 107474]